MAVIPDKGVAASPPGGAAVALATLRQGQSGVITETRLDADDAALLKAMGLCTSAAVRVVRSGQPCVVAVGGTGGVHGEACACGGTCRIGLAKRLAERIFVTAVA